MNKEKKFLKLIKKITVTVETIYFTAISAVPAMADSTGVAKVDAGLTTIKNLASGVVGGIGVIVLAKGGYDIAVAISQRDISGISTAAGELAGGLIMVSITAFIALVA